MDLGDKVRELLCNAGMTQEQYREFVNECLGDEYGKPPGTNTISRWCRNIHKPSRNAILVLRALSRMDESQRRFFFGRRDD